MIQASSHNASGELLAPALSPAGCAPHPAHNALVRTLRDGRDNLEVHQRNKRPVAALSLSHLEEPLNHTLPLTPLKGVQSAGAVLLINKGLRTQSVQ